jgi:hypothetical protein
MGNCRYSKLPQAHRKNARYEWPFPPSKAAKEHGARYLQERVTAHPNRRQQSNNQ